MGEFLAGAESIFAKGGNFIIELKDNTEYNNKEIAEWFGIKEASFSRHKKQKLKELKKYAEFQDIWGGIYIIKVIESPFLIKDKVRKYVEEHFLETWDREGLETCARVAAKLYLGYQELHPNDEIKLRTFEYLVTQQRGLHFPAHRREKTWCKMYGAIGFQKTVNTTADNIYEEFTQDQKTQFIEEFFNRYKKDKVAEAILTLNEQYKQGALKDGITWNKAWKQFNEITGADEVPYTCFLKDMSAKFGSDWIINAARVFESGSWEN